jgi:hypothetical protein
VILARLFGGLGNQLFQYACARRLAHGLGETMKLDLSAFEAYGPRKYALETLSVSAPVATEREVADFERRAGVSARLPRWLLRAVPGWRYEVFRERSFAFDPEVLELRGNILLEGYWQSERYFRDIADLVRREFALKPALSAHGASLATRILGCSAVSVHVRRGDFVTNPAASRVHGVCEPDYYERAVETIARDEPQPHLFLFSDDPQWTAQNLRFRFPATLIEGAAQANPAEHLQLMSLCRHHVIANSSFSWWGAWLNPRPGKRVVAPNKWFNTATKDTRDLIPSGWTRV